MPLSTLRFIAYGVSQEFLRAAVDPAAVLGQLAEGAGVEVTVDAAEANSLRGVMDAIGFVEIPVTAAPGQPGYYGDGSDGAVVYAVNTVLSADVRAITVAVAAGVVVDVNGYEITATVSITNDGIIHQDGHDAAGAVAGTASANVAQATAFAVGSAGGAPAVAGGPSSLAGGGTTTVDQLGGSGGAGGGGGAAGGNNGIGLTLGLARHPFLGPSPTDLNAVGVYLPCGCGGGGGGGAGAGAGGGGAGIVRLRAPNIVNNGSVQAVGGIGGDATLPTGGGGGGGGGGRVIVVGRLTGSGAISVVGGVGGVGVAGNGVSGSAGDARLF